MVQVMFRWLQEFIDIRMNYVERVRQVEICESCETLKMQLSIANQTNEKLLERIFNKPVEAPPIDTSELKPINQHKAIPWNTRRQMLEAEDRATAKILREQAKSEETKIEDLEKELGVAEELRINEGGSHAV